MSKIAKPFVWYGGKGRMLNKILPLVPAGGLPYAEPYAGSAALFFARAPAPVEALNDLDGRIVNFYRVMQSEKGFAELKRRLEWTPYARAEFVRALETLNAPNASEVDRAWAFFTAANQSISGRFEKAYGWGRVIKTSINGMAGTASSWQTRIKLLDKFRARLMRAQIDQRDALEFIQYWDNDDAVLYVDPPYHLDTRTKDKRMRYAHEADDAHHRTLVETLLKCKGAIVLSGYMHEVYKPLEEAGWQRFDFAVACSAAGRTRGSGLQGDGAAKKKVLRTECIWVNPRAAEMNKKMF